MPENYKNLVFEGGGVKGIAYGGAITRLDEMNILSGITRVAGTSAGAITACLLSVGYDSKSFAKIISETKFSHFEDNTFLYIRDIFRLINKYGWNKGDTFLNWISDLIEKKTGDRNFTFRNLHDEIISGNKKNFKELYIAVTNVTKQRPEIISYETYPDLPIAKAIRMSMSIPIFFTSVKDENNNVFVDGGLTMNYPVQIFDNVKYLNNPANCIKAHSDYDADFAFNYETLGLKVSSKAERNYLNPNWEGDPSLTKNLKKFIGALMVFTLEMVNNKHLNSNDWNRTIFIDIGNVGTTDFNLKQESIDFLLKNGNKAVDDYFFWKNDDLRWANFPK